MSLLKWLAAGVFNLLALSVYGQVGSATSRSSWEAGVVGEHKTAVKYFAGFRVK